MANAVIIREKINTNVNVLEPVTKILSEIDEKQDQVVVLKGSRGSGKTTVLLTKEAQNKEGAEIEIYHHFDHVGIGVTSADLGADFIKHKFELEMASALLHFLLSKGITTTTTEVVRAELARLRKLFVYDINMLGINGKLKSEIKSPGYFTEDLIGEIKKVYSPQKLSFLIDRFDWMFNRSFIAQECIRDYFPLFDQVVLTTDDENYSSKYPTIEVDYGKDKIVVKEIINKFIEQTNASKSFDERLDLKNISEDTYDYVVEQANGDIETILRAVNNLYNCSSEEDLNIALRDKITSNVSYQRKLRLSEVLRPKFYI